ncbi:hypothetical protein LXD69_09115 [Flavobacterium sediminilitoris]|uniref:LTXXQ motif family protein n=1 Tax=Flavobacterium sediminilitoris TaxID=2024526 RepID=A0ABY4HH96_9FLAO|nr:MULTISPECIES: hypothetical protein [Flavobacterium]UOX32216.1 hypothetical protein LXD69_09115 [Flavobacterium sediminilitoris]
MKKVFLTLVILVSTLAFSQSKENRKERMDSEKMAELHVKKMTLDLDLTEKQQKEIKPIFLEQAKKREAKRNELKMRKEKGEKLSSDERFEMKNKALDNQIEMKSKLKNILTPAQMEKWENNKKKRSNKAKKHAKRIKSDKDEK